MNKFLKNNSFFIISFGAVPAAILRWQIDHIFITNILGCFLLGLIHALPISKKYKLFIGFGFCSSFTTFSGWSFQLFEFISKGFYKFFFLNIITQMTLGIVAFALGHFFAKKIIT
tara:strand:+ start:77 stop:421 length:345 start_codon:yes stop_codon:yes gene_type:complete